MTTRGLSERRSLQVIGMSASALRYQPRPDRNGLLRQKIVALAQRHRRYGAAMIYLKLRQAGELINHKRVERLSALEKLQVRRRRRKKIPVSERQPLIRPGAANQVWSADFVFDRVASGRMLKCLLTSTMRLTRRWPYRLTPKGTYFRDSSCSGQAGLVPLSRSLSTSTTKGLLTGALRSRDRALSGDAFRAHKICCRRPLSFPRGTLIATSTQTRGLRTNLRGQACWPNGYWPQFARRLGR